MLNDLTSRSPATSLPRALRPQRISDDMATITLSLASGSIHAANAAAHDILRYPAGSLRGRSILDLMPPEIALIHRCSWSTPAGDHELSAAFSPCMFVRPVEMARFDKTRVAVCLEVPEPSEAEGDAEGAPEKAKGAAGDRSGTQPAEGEPATIDVNVIVCKRDEVEEDTVMTLAVDPDSGRVTAVRGSALFGYEEGSALSSGSLTLSSVLHMSTSPSDLASAWAADPPRDGTPCMVKLANGGMEAALAVVSMHDLRKSRRSGPGRPPTWARQSQPGSGRPSWEHGSYLEVKLVRMDAVRILISLDESLGCKDIQSSTHCLTLTRTLAQAKGMPLSTLLPAVPMEGTLNDLFGEEEEEGEQEEREGGDGEEDRAATEGQQYVAGPRMEGIQLVMAHGPRIVTAMQAFKEEGKSEGVLMVCPMPGEGSRYLCPVCGCEGL